MAVTTVYTYDLNGSKKDFDVPFEYLARRFVQVTLIGQDRKPLDLASDFRFIGKTSIQTLKAWGPADGYERIEIRRNTSATDRLVDFADGSILRANELNTSQVQTLHVAEEARNMVVDTIGADNNGNLDARGRRIVNTADGVEPGDAVTLRQEQAWAASTLGNRNAAEAARDRAVTAQNISESKAGEAMASATTSKAQADRAKSEADRSVAAAGTIGDSVAQAAASASAASSSAVQAAANAKWASDCAVSAQASATYAEGQVVAATNTVNAVRMAAKQLGMSEWGWRERPFDGYLLDDGQELDRSLYPAFAAALDAGLLPTTTEALWQANPTFRGCFVANSSTGKFRMRDRNGKSSGSLGAVVLRGDGLKSSGVTGVIQLDAFQGHKHRSVSYSIQRGATDFNPIFGGDTASTLPAQGGFAVNNTGYSVYTATSDIPDGVSGAPRTATETRMLNMTGAWMTFAFGTITALGAAEAASLATAYASAASRITTVETRSKWQVTDAQYLVGNNAVSIRGIPDWARQIEVDIWKLQPAQTSDITIKVESGGALAAASYLGTTSAVGSGVAHRSWTYGLDLTYSAYEANRALVGTVSLQHILWGGGWMVSGMIDDLTSHAIKSYPVGVIEMTTPISGIQISLPQNASHKFTGGIVGVRYRA